MPDFCSFPEIIIQQTLYNVQDKMPGYKSIYRTAPELYKIKGKLERHLCSVTDTLFNQQNRIVLFDLTNFYFESRKEKSRKGEVRTQQGEARRL